MESVLTVLRKVRRFLGRPRQSAEKRSVREKIQKSGLFDPKYYRSRYQDVALSGIDPLQHFIGWGMREQRRPSLDFDPVYYLALNPDVQCAGIDPLLHYIDHGRAEGRRCRLSHLPKLKIDTISPDASIVIPVHCHLPYVLNCLDSLSEQTSFFSAEIIIAGESANLDAIPLEAIPWIRHWQAPPCETATDLLHLAAQTAAGRFLVFLRAETRVAKGWLDELIGSFELFPKAGMIVSKICNEGADDVNHPKYCYARRLDSTPGVSFAVRANFSGHEIWLQPLSQVVRCTTEPRPQGSADDEDAHRRLLVVDEITPMPDRDSGSFITSKMLKAFQQLGYKITFIPQHQYAYAGAYTNSLQRLGIECLYAPYFQNISDVLNYRDDFDFVLAYRHNVLGEIYDEIRRRMPQARIVFHNVDLHFLREEREAELYGNEEKRIAAEATRTAELDLIAKVDCTIVHTTAESAIIRKLLPVENIVEFPYIAQVNRAQATFENRYHIMFLGGFSHPPNVDAVLHFAHSIWPLLLQRLPEQARFVIVGPSPPPEIQSLSGPRIVVAGHVEDLKLYFEAARVFVAPLRYGAGIKGKVIQSLCYGTPSVITPLAAEGIGLTSGKETMIAEDDERFAEQVLALYSDRALWHSLQAAGYRFVEEHFSWERCLQLCQKALDVAEATWIARRAAIAAW